MTNLHGLNTAIGRDVHFPIMIQWTLITVGEKAFTKPFFFPDRQPYDHKQVALSLHPGTLITVGEKTFTKPFFFPDKQPYDHKQVALSLHPGTAQQSP